ncbi:MAG: hypothetical protein ACRD22_02010 [Terriglobia bacterium]
MSAFAPLPQTGGLVNNYTYQPEKTQQIDAMDGKVDYQKLRVIALDAATGKLKWSFSPIHSGIWNKMRNRQVKERNDVRL